MSFFSYAKLENRKVEWSCLGGGVGTSVGGEGHGRVNMAQILCTHVYKWKNDIQRNYSRNGGERKENGRGDDTS
jgi:hypothetical protein